MQRVHTLPDNPNPNDVKPLFIADIDGTLIRNNSFCLLMEQLFSTGAFSEEAYNAFEDAREAFQRRRINHRTFDQLIIAIFTEQLGTTSFAAVRRAANAAAREHGELLYGFSKAFVAAFKTTHRRITISGALIELLEGFKRHHETWDFDAFYCTTYRVEADRAVDCHYYVDNKGAAIDQELAGGLSTLKGSIGIGDTENDIDFLKRVELPVAFNPTFALARHATHAGWPIVEERKDKITVLFQGTVSHFNITCVGNAIDLLLSTRELAP